MERQYSGHSIKQENTECWKEERNKEKKLQKDKKILCKYVATEITILTKDIHGLYHHYKERSQSKDAGAE